MSDLLTERRFREARLELWRASLNLLDAWEGKGIDATEGYPFTESFDEVVQHIADWMEAPL